MTGPTLVILGNATLYLGDAYKIVPTLGEVSCLCTDPPYEFNASGGGIFRKNRTVMDRIEASGLDKGFDCKIFNPELHHSIIVFCHNDQIHKVAPYLAENYKRYALCGWRKTNPMPVANKHYQPEIEIYFHAWNKGYHPMGELKDKKRIFDYQVGKSKYEHPTVKPLELMRKIMKNVNGDTILDPFAGTGSTGIAALEAGKKFIGIEHDPEYFNIMLSRIYEFYSNASCAPMLTKI